MSVVYHLAPGAPFPAAVEDAIAAMKWVAAHLTELSGDERLAVAGDRGPHSPGAQQAIDDSRALFATLLHG